MYTMRPLVHDHPFHVWYCLSFYACLLQTEQRDFKDSLYHCQSETQSGEMQYPRFTFFFSLWIIVFTMNICACHSLNLNISPEV